MRNAACDLGLGARRANQGRSAVESDLVGMYPHQTRAGRQIRARTAAPPSAKRLAVDCPGCFAKEGETPSALPTCGLEKE